MTLKLGRNLITNHLSKIGDEQWDIYEQIFIAAIDIGDFLSAEHYLQLITTQFPGISPQIHSNFTRISPQFHPNLIPISPIFTGKIQIQREFGVWLVYCKKLVVKLNMLKKITMRT